MHIYMLVDANIKYCLYVKCLYVKYCIVMMLSVILIRIMVVVNACARHGFLRRLLGLYVSGHRECASLPRRFL